MFPTNEYQMNEIDNSMDFPQSAPEAPASVSGETVAESLATDATHPPRRPLTAYNIFFQLERQRLINEEDEREFSREEITALVEEQRYTRNLPKPKRKHRKTHGKISFTNMARVIAARWKTLDDSDKKIFDEFAAKEKSRYEGGKQKESCDVITPDSYSVTNQSRVVSIEGSMRSFQGPNPMCMPPRPQSYSYAMMQQQRQRAMMRKMMMMRRFQARFNRMRRAQFMAAQMQRQHQQQLRMMPQYYQQQQQEGSFGPFMGFNAGNQFFSGNDADELDNVQGFVDNAFNMAQASFSEINNGYYQRQQDDSMPVMNNNSYNMNWPNMNGYNNPQMQSNLVEQTFCNGSQVNEVHEVDQVSLAGPSDFASYSDGQEDDMLKQLDILPLDDEPLDLCPLDSSAQFDSFDDNCY